MARLAAICCSPSTRSAPLRVDARGAHRPPPRGTRPARRRVLVGARAVPRARHRDGAGDHELPVAQPATTSTSPSRRDHVDLADLEQSSASATQTTSPGGALCVSASPPPPSIGRQGELDLGVAAQRRGAAPSASSGSRAAAVPAPLRASCAPARRPAPRRRTALGRRRSRRPLRSRRSARRSAVVERSSARRLRGGGEARGSCAIGGAGGGPLRSTEHRASKGADLVRLDGGGGSGHASSRSGPGRARCASLRPSSVARVVSTRSRLPLPLGHGGVPALDLEVGLGGVAHLGSPRGRELEVTRIRRRIASRRLMRPPATSAGGARGRGRPRRVGRTRRAVARPSRTPEGRVALRRSTSTTSTGRTRGGRSLFGGELPARVALGRRTRRRR